MKFIINLNFDQNLEKRDVSDFFKTDSYCPSVYVMNEDPTLKLFFFDFFSKLSVNF